MSAKKSQTKIMVFGTFDGLHPGHLDFWKQARSLASNPYLIVSVARDKNVLAIKGERPHLDEQKRLALIKQSTKKNNLVDKVVFSGVYQHIPHIVREHPSIIALGYDQKAYVKNLKKDLKNKGIIVRVVRLKPYKEKIYKNKLLYAKNSKKEIKN